MNNFLWACFIEVVLVGFIIGIALLLVMVIKELSKDVPRILKWIRR